MTDAAESRDPSPTRDPQGPPEVRPERNVTRTRVFGVLGATLAAAAVWVIAVPVLGVHLMTRFGNQDAQTVGFGLVLTAALVGSLAGLGLLVVLEKIGRAHV